MRQRRKTPITPELRAEMVKLRNEGMSFDKIAERTDYTKRSVMSAIMDAAMDIEPRRKGRLSPEAFIKIWQESASVDEVIEKTGMRAQAIFSRANSYRQHGVNLKRMPPRMAGRAMDWEGLAEFAELFNDDESETE